MWVDIVSPPFEARARIIIYRLGLFVQMAMAPMTEWSLELTPAFYMLLRDHPSR